MGRNKISTIFFLSVILFILTAFPIAAQEPSINELTDQQKQQEILDMVNSHRNALPSELVLAIIRLEGGEGAFHVDGQVYNSFYRQSDVPWAQPKNGDGIMQVTAASGYHKTFTHDRAGYDLAISSGCNYISEHYNAYGTYVQTALHYNTGPNSLYIYLGKNQGDRNYLSHVAGYLSNFISNIYGLEDQNLADSLNRGQKILNDYLYDKGIATGQSIDYYKPYQAQLDNDLYNIEYSTQDNVPPTIDTNSKFKLGERIWTTTDVKVRADPGLTSAQINSMADGNSMIKGNAGTVLDGPISKDGYTWWKVNYDIGVTGWSAENYLELVPNGPQQPSNFAQWSEDAIEWGENNINSRDWWDSKEKIGYCLRFVANAFMQEKVKGQTGSESAIETAQKFYRFNQEQKGWQYAPRGALIFFNAKGSNPYGHVGIYLGDGKNIINAYGTVQEISIESISVQKDVGYYIGWSYPPTEWHRDDNTLDDNVEINCQWCCEEGKMMGLRNSGALPSLTSEQTTDIISRCQQAGCLDSYNQALTTGTCDPTQTQPPNVPTTPNQFKLDGSSISGGAQIADRSVAFKAKVSSLNGGKLRLQVELRRLDEYGGQFDETKGGLKESDKVDSNKEATAYAYGLINGYYHWRARAIDESEKTSDWVDFGNNQGADFIVYSNTVEPIGDINISLLFFEGSLKGPILPGVRITGHDGTDKSFNQITNSNGLTAIKGSPGTWHFEASKKGYETKTWDWEITDNAGVDVFLVKIIENEGIDLYLTVHDGSIYGQTLSGVLVTGYDGKRNKFTKTTDSNGLIVLKGSTGTWHFEASKDGYQTNTWDQELISSANRDAFLNAEPNTGTTFNKGDRVRTTSDKKLNVRSGAGTSSSSIGTMVKGSMGTVMDGPVFADNLYWWKVEYDAGITGWSSGKWLELASTETHDTEQITGTTFNKGDRVRTTSDKKLNVRSSPGTSSSSIGTMVKGSIGTIIDGPILSGNLYWWIIEYDVGITGWSSGKWLELAPQTQIGCNRDPVTGQVICSDDASLFSKGPIPQTLDDEAVTYATYCTNQGYNYQNRQCIFSDGTSCDAGAFYRGECEYSPQSNNEPFQPEPGCMRDPVTGQMICMDDFSGASQQPSLVGPAPKPYPAYGY